MVKARRIEYPVSAGGVVCKKDGEKVEVVICGRTEPPSWSLPKGTPNPGEDIEETAIREVTEETGLEVDLKDYIGSIDYWFVRSKDRVRCHKTVHFYLMSPKGGSISHHDPEFDVIQWVTADDALKTLTHINEAHIVEEALSLVAEKTKRD